MASITRLTIEDFEKLPDELAKNRELVEGELVDVSGNTGSHNRLRDRLIALLIPVVDDADRGMTICEQEFNFDGNVHGPDLVFLSPAKARLFDGSRRVQPFVPDLAVEIVSRNDTFEGLMVKAALYRKCGTREVWVLSQATRQAFVQSEARQTILNDDGLFESPQIPGFSVALGYLFDRAA